MTVAVASVGLPNGDDFERREMRFGSIILLFSLVFSPSFCLQLMAAEPAPDVAVAADSLVAVDQLIASGHYPKAAERLRYLDDHSTSGDLTQRLVQTAHGLQQSGDLQSSVDLYLRAVSLVATDRAKTMDSRSRTLVHLAAASALVQAIKHAEALDCLIPIFSTDQNVSPEHREMAVRLCLHVGSESLRQGKLTLAERAYKIAFDHASPSQREKAQLGAAWTVAMASDRPEIAATMLSQFVTDFPENTDAHRAIRLAATCFRQAGNNDESTKTLEVLLARWPDSISADEVVRSHFNLSTRDIPQPVRQWLVRRAGQSESDTDDASMCALGIRVAAEEGAADAIDVFARRLAEVDETGQATSDLLQQLVYSNRLAEAERIASGWIAPHEDAIVATAAREAACRWAGRHELWSMLSLASESLEPSQASDQRTATIERLFAEALMQTGQPADAHRWWTHVVDQHGADDFATLVRCAETATSHAAPAEAEKRIAAARIAAGEDASRRSLIEMLAAELAVRRLEFDEARSKLESIIRDPESISQLRGRAQWLIGETYFLQERFADAIDAYRRVEGIDADGPWVAAALVQAGKSFEQLGRTQEASVCYSTLIRRFADHPHSQAARIRLAALTPNSAADNQNGQNLTIHYIPALS